jgi:hypothetical protein
MTRARIGRVDHFKSHSQEVVDSFHNVAPPSESNSDDDREVFMVGQSDVLGNQTEEEIA